MSLEVGPGDVVAVLGSHGVFSKVIQFSEWLSGKPHLVDHVVVVTHQDVHGRWIGISGQPGGVAVCDVSKYLLHTEANSNHAQPKLNDAGQLNSFLASAAKSIGLSYDWVAVAEDALDSFHLHDLSEELNRIWAWPTVNNVLPGHLVCSSLAARLYELVGWAHPDLGLERVCTPADWWAWANSEGWKQAICKHVAQVSARPGTQYDCYHCRASYIAREHDDDPLDITWERIT